jgi:hypothetical protein
MITVSVPDTGSSPQARRCGRWQNCRDCRARFHKAASLSRADGAFSRAIWRHAHNGDTCDAVHAQGAGIHPPPTGHVPFNLPGPGGGLPAQDLAAAGSPAHRAGRRLHRRTPVHWHQPISLPVLLYMAKAWEGEVIAHHQGLLSCRHVVETVARALRKLGIVVIHHVPCWPGIRPALTATEFCIQNATTVPGLAHLLASKCLGVRLCLSAIRSSAPPCTTRSCANLAS